MLLNKINLSDYKLSRIMCIDYGKKRVGFALSDPLHIISYPKDYLLAEDQKYWEKIHKLISENEVKLVVIGYPYESKNTKILEDIDKFIKSLANKNPEIDIIKQDENFTSQKALNNMIESGMKKKDRKQKQNVDMFAASVILKEFLEENQ